MEAETLKLIHELQVHKIELELQNEELMLAKNSGQEIAEKYIELFDHCPSGYITLTAAGEIQSVNIAGARMFGKERAALQDKLFRNFLSQDTVTGFNLFFTNAFESRNNETCMVTLSLNGRPPTHIHLAGTVSGTGDVCRVSMFDITERKQMDMEMKKAQDALGNFFHIVPDMVAIASPDGYLKNLNSAWEKTLGFTIHELENLPYERLIHPDDIASTQMEVAKQLQGGTTARFENRYRHKDGSYKWLEWNAIAGEDGNLYAGARDITTRKKAENALLESEERHRSILHTAMDGFWLVNLNGHLLKVNEAYCRMSGYTEQELLGMRIIDLESAETAAATAAHIQVIIAKGEDRFISKHCKKDGSMFDVEVSVQFKDVEGGRIIAFLQDITERKQAEESLRKSKERYRHSELELNAAQSVAHIGSWKWDINTGKVFWSDEMYRIFGVDKNSFSGSLENVIINTMHPEDLHIVSNATELAKKIPMQYRIVLPDASIRTIYSLTGDPILDSAGNPAYLTGVAQDITERKQTDDALRESELKYSDMAMNIPGVLFQLFVRKDGTRGYHYVSPKATEIFNLSSDQSSTDWNLGERIHPDDKDMFAASMNEAIAQMNVWNYEGRILTIEGVRWFQCIARPIGKNDEILFNGILIDTTERKHAEQLLVQEKERLAVTLRSIGDGVITTDTDGRIIMLNKVAEDMTGWSSGDAVGRLLPEVFHILNELTREPNEDPVKKVLSTGRIVELANHTCLISKTGTEIQIADSAAPIRDNESRITGVVLVFRDMTEKQRLNDSIQRTQKLESLGILAGGIAHDFNNMLAGIFGYLDLAKESAAVNKTDQIPKYLDKATGVFDRAKGLTQQLLTFSKGGAPLRKTQLISPLIQHSAAFALSGSNVTCQFDLAADLWACDCDETQIGQVMDNFVINARQAMPMGGKITITAVNVKEVPGHLGSFVRISIQDEGIGIPHDVLPKIFDPFFSTKKTGHGLGLSTVFSIIMRHGGWIDVDSTPEKGSIFHTFIPASLKNMSFEIELETMKHTSTGSILVMDDEDFILEIVSTMLGSMGYTVARAKDGEEALALFTEAERSGQPFAATILDLTIPGGIGGKEVVVAMREINQNSIIIVSSGYSEDPVIANFARHGFTDRIIKPYRKNELTELMKRIYQ